MARRRPRADRPAARRATASTGAAPTSSTSRDDARASMSRLQVWWTQDGREAADPAAARQDLHDALGLQGAAGEASRRPATGGWSAPSPRGCSATSPARSPAAARARSPRACGDYMLYGPIFVADLEKDLDLVAADLRPRLLRPLEAAAAGRTTRSAPSRPLLSPQRSLGSVIKLLTPSDDYTAEYNAWLASFPDHIYPWSSSSSATSRPGVGRRLAGALRRGLDQRPPGPRAEGDGPPAGRQLPARRAAVRAGLADVQAPPGLRRRRRRCRRRTTSPRRSSSRPTSSGTSPPDARAGSYKFAVNCEYRLFQRPDDAIHRGLDKQTEADLARPDNFLSNFEPLTAEQARRPGRPGHGVRPVHRRRCSELLQAAAEDGIGYVVCSAYPRLVDGKPSKNPRYLQIRPDLLDPPGPLRRRARACAWRGRSRPTSRCPMPVGAVLIGRRNNPPDRAGGHPAAGRLQPDPLPGTARAVHGLHLLADRQEPVDDGRRLGGRADQGPVQRPADDRRSQRRRWSPTSSPGLAGFSTAAGYVGPHRARRPRHQPAHPGDLVPPRPPGSATRRS